MHRPVFVDLETARMFVTQAMGDDLFVGEQGNLIATFLPTGVETGAERYDVYWGSRLRGAAGAIALRTGIPDLALADAKHLVNGGAPVGMTRAQIARTLLSGVSQSATRHRDITEGRMTDEFGPTLPNGVIYIRNMTEWHPA